MQRSYLRTGAAATMIGAGASIAGGCWAANHAPTAVITEPNGTIVRPLDNDPYRIVLSVNRDDIIKGTENFIFEASDTDGPGVLKASSIYTVGGNPVKAVTNAGGSGTRNRITIPFKLVPTGDGEISRGTYNLLRVNLDDEYFLSRPVGYTVTVDVSRGSSLSDDPTNGDDQPDNGDGIPNLDDLLRQSRAEFGSIVKPITELTQGGFRVELSIPKELEDRVDSINFEMVEFGGNPNVNVATINGKPYKPGDRIEPTKIGDGLYEVEGTIKSDGSGSPYEALDARFLIKIGGGTISINDSLEAIIK